MEALAVIQQRFYADFPAHPDEVPPPPRTKWTRRVPHPVLIGHAASLTPHRRGRAPQRLGLEMRGRTLEGEGEGGREGGREGVYSRDTGRCNSKLGWRFEVGGLRLDTRASGGFALEED
jgi:hypothetical protein